MQGTQAVALSILDDHDGGVGDIHAHLDDGGGYQGIQPAGFEIVHYGGFFLWLELTVHQADPAVGEKGLGNVLVVTFHGVQPAVRRVLDGGTDDIYLPSGSDLPVKKAVEIPPLFSGDAPGLDGLAARGQLIKDRDV